jgi:small subunit ribosomal protein S16
MVKIRLKRIGQRNRPTYRIVVQDSQRSRDGKYIESLGHYNPRDKSLVLDKERADHWLSKGAQPSDTAGRLLRRYTKLTTPPPIAPAEPTAEAPVEVPVDTPALSPESAETTAAPEGGKDETTG